MSNMRAILLYNLKINFQIKYFEYCSRSFLMNVKCSMGSSPMHTKSLWDIFPKHIMPLKKKAGQTVYVLSNNTKWDLNTNLKPETEKNTLVRLSFWREPQIVWRKRTSICCLSVVLQKKKKAKPWIKSWDKQCWELPEPHTECQKAPRSLYLLPSGKLMAAYPSSTRLHRNNKDHWGTDKLFISDSSTCQPLVKKWYTGCKPQIYWYAWAYWRGREANELLLLE